MTSPQQPEVASSPSPGPTAGVGAVGGETTSAAAAEDAARRAGDARDVPRAGGFGLAARIALAASALTLLFVTGIGAVSYVVTRAQITQGVKDGLSHQAALLASRLSTTLNSVATTLSELKQNALVLNSLMDSYTRRTSLDPFLADFSTINGVPVEITLTDFEGNPVAGAAGGALGSAHWKVGVLERGLPYVTVEERAGRATLLVAEPIFYVGTLSPEGALVHRIDLARLVGESAPEVANGSVQLLYNGRSILGQDPSAGGTGRSRRALTQTKPLELHAMLAPLRLDVRLRADPALIRGPLAQLTLIYLLIGLAVLIGAVLFSALAARRLARPLRELEQVAASVVASGSVDHRFEVGAFAEVARLGQTFNLMLERLGAAQHQLARLAHHDALTGLANRIRFHQQLSAALADVQRSHDTLGVLLLDLDNFKDVNDTLGHPVGDELLKQVAGRLRALVRATDTVARLGGDEFAIIATHLTDSGAAAVLGNKMVEAISESFEFADHEIYVSASVGIAVCPSDGDSSEQLLKNADLALYKAKQEGRCNFQFFDQQLNDAAQTRKQIEASIRAAIDEAAFCLHYQPRIDLETGTVAGVEALVRWRSAGRMVYPDAFVPVAEESRLIVPLGEWILRAACEQKRTWDRQGMCPFTVAVNLSAIQLGRDDYVERLLAVVEDSGVDPAGLEIEITESALMERVDVIADRLARFRALGVRLAIDDIGTGYSSLVNLKRLSVDVLKIDKSFIRDLEDDPDDAAITRAIIQLGTSLDLTVVAEGVEKPGQESFLRRQGCHQAQGYLYAAALPPEELAVWVRQRGLASADTHAVVTGSG
ncbi:MAG: EAL domain-containing protein [Rhodocyclaceae bacterium]|nr:EAL domain-containing protein [Rhodocyclaceae bacterium]